MQKLKINDVVEVIAGNSKGKQGKILSFNKDRSRATVEKVALVKRHTKPSQQNPTGGIVEKEATIHISNLMLVNPKSKKREKVGIQIKGDKKIRVFKKTGNELK